MSGELRCGSIRQAACCLSLAPCCRPQRFGHRRRRRRITPIGSRFLGIKGSGFGVRKYHPSDVVFARPRRPSQSPDYVNWAAIKSTTSQTGDHVRCFQRTRFHTAVAPGTGQTFTATLFVGPPLTLTATAVTCVIADTATTCSDTTQFDALITPGQYAWRASVQPRRFSSMERPLVAPALRQLSFAGDKFCIVTHC